MVKIIVHSLANWSLWMVKIIVHMLTLKYEFGSDRSMRRCNLDFSGDTVEELQW